MTNPCLISVCIPTYKRIEFLKRLLDSLEIQIFRDFEVIITDDSPDEKINLLWEQHQYSATLRYYRNDPKLGTPENWNEAVSKAKGTWIKIMHDDDWFADEHSLQHFADAVTYHPSGRFIFSAYQNVALETGETRDVFTNPFRFRMLQKNPVTLFSRNVIGPPSVVMYLREEATLFDRRLKWVVDIDFYIRSLAAAKPVYINKVLVKVGIGGEQVTRDCFLQRPIEIPENFALLNKVGTGNLANILVYDGWWRLMRNLEIKKEDEIRESGYAGPIPAVIISMIHWQRRMPIWLLKTGFLSKAAMTIHYILKYSKIGN